MKKQNKNGFIPTKVLIIIILIIAGAGIYFLKQAETPVDDRTMHITN